MLNALYDILYITLPISPHHEVAEFQCDQGASLARLAVAKEVDVVNGSMVCDRKDYQGPG